MSGSRPLSRPSPGRRLPPPALPSPIRFDLGTDRIDASHADLKLWKRHIREVLTRQDRLGIAKAKKHKEGAGK